MSNTSLVDRWHSPRVTRVLPNAHCHSVHTYFITSPESPDGSWILFYQSSTPEGHSGDLRIVHRASAEERILAEGITVEDIHRAASQQWACGGSHVVFQDLREGEWVIAAVNIESLEERILARDRQLGFGQPRSNEFPIYGLHWEPGQHRDIELLNLNTGQTRSVLALEEIRTAHSDWIEEHYQERQISLFFPVMSPDMNRLFFKLSSPTDGRFRIKNASLRIGFFCYDLESQQHLICRTNWGHPAWHPDSRSVLNCGKRSFEETNIVSGNVDELNAPRFPGAHPSFSSCGHLVVTDTRYEAFGGSEGEWAVAVVDPVTGDHQFIHHFTNNRGATSWRVSHPHPVFSPDGQRIYFNVSADRWSRLYVAEAE